MLPILTVDHGEREGVGAARCAAKQGRDVADKSKRPVARIALDEQKTPAMLPGLP